jgi:TatD DNase family protein
MHLYDAHCHLQDERYTDRSPAQLTAAARAVGVVGMMCCGTHETDWGRVAGIGRRLAGVAVCLGLHPWYAAERTAGWLKTLRRRLQDTPRAGVGEIGLDHALKNFDLDDQEDVFVQQYRLSIELGRPASLHCRRAFGRMLEVVTDSGPHPAGFVIHSYSGSAELIEPLTRLGGYFSFSGTITYPKRRRVVKALQAVPAERLLIETDAPDMTPFVPGAGAAHFDPHGLGLNEPARLPAVLQRAAVLRDCGVSTLADQVWRNACALFGTPGELQAPQIAATESSGPGRPSTTEAL